MFSAIVNFFPLLTLVLTLLDISILQEKTEQYIQFYLPEKKLPSCATIPSFLFKVVSYSPAIIRPCAVFVIWSQSLSHLAGKRRRKKTASFVECSFSPLLHREVYWMVQQWQLPLWLCFCWPNFWFSLPPKPNKKDRDRIGGNRKVALRILM